MAINPLLMCNAGDGAAEEKLYVDDVFSTYLYDGTGAAQDIVNGIDLAGEGGMVWVKSRTDAVIHRLTDTERGAYLSLSSQLTNTNIDTTPYGVTGFNSDGFSVADTSTGGFDVCKSGSEYVSWTFRKAPKFFDMVKYTGDGVAGREIPHDLGCDVGMMIGKSTTLTYSWNVYHKSVYSTYPNGVLYLEQNSAVNTANGPYFFGDGVDGIPPTATTFTVSNNGNVLGEEYIVYLFAHDPDPDGMIQCGSFTTDGSGFFDVDLGWEPQYILFKQSGVSGNWMIMDSMRGITDSSVARLYPNISNAESNIPDDDYLYLTATGFANSANTFGANQPVVYMAIRRPNKPPESADEVFAIDTRNSTEPSIAPGFRSGFPVDFSIVSRTVLGNNYVYTRLTQEKQLVINLTDNEGESSQAMVDYNNGYSNIVSQPLPDLHAYMFKRTPGFFDVVCYTGTGVARTVNHNLGVAPEMMIVKQRVGAVLRYWSVYVGLNGATKVLVLNETSVMFDSFDFSQTAPTSSLFYVGSNNTNTSTNTYIAYLFASLPGISSVFSYTGNGTSINIDMGFSTGCRFCLLKRTDAAGDWFIWDSLRGIVAGDDPHLSLNTTAAQVTTDDSVDPYTAGITINQVTTTNLNVNGATYIGYGIA